MIALIAATMFAAAPPPDLVCAAALANEAQRLAPIDATGAQAALVAEARIVGRLTVTLDAESLTLVLRDALALASLNTPAETRQLATQCGAAIRTPKGG